MVKLRVLDLLEQKGRTKYWLFKQLDMSYQNFNRMINNETQSVMYKNLDAMCLILECEPGDLFEYNPEEI